MKTRPLQPLKTLFAARETVTATVPFLAVSLRLHLLDQRDSKPSCARMGNGRERAFFL